MDATILSPEQRQAAAAAMKVARDKDRPALNALIVTEGMAIVTDARCAINVATLSGLPEGGWDAVALGAALKGAGKEWARISVDGDRLTVERFSPPQFLRDDAVRSLDLIPSDIVAATYASKVEGYPTSIVGIFREAVEAVEAEGYMPDSVGFDPDLLSTVLDARPSLKVKGPPVPVRVLPRGMKAAVVSEGRKPYAIIMPMRD